MTGTPQHSTNDEGNNMVLEPDTESAEAPGTSGTTRTAEEMQALETAKQMLVTWFQSPMVGDDVLQRSCDALQGIPGINDELLDEAVNAILWVSDPHEGKVVEMLQVFAQWCRIADRRARGPLRRRLLGDFYSPFCQNKEVLKNYGDTLQRRLDQVGFEVVGCNVDPVVVHCPVKKRPVVLNEPMHEVDMNPVLIKKEALPNGDRNQSINGSGALSDIRIGDDGLDSLGLSEPDVLLVNTITRKDITEGRRLAQGITPIVYSGTGDALPYVVFKRRFDLLCRQNGLIGDPVSVYHLLLRCLSPALIVALNPSVVGLGIAKDWIREIGRLFSSLSLSCSGVSDDVARLGASQSFANITQSQNETVSEFIVRFSNASSDLTAYLGAEVDDEKLRTTFLKALLPVWRSTAMDILSRGGDLQTVERELSQRERLEKAVNGSTRGSSPSTSTTRVRLNAISGEVSTGEEGGGAGQSGQQRRHRRQSKLVKKPCFQWRDTGTCTFGDKCRFLHEQSNIANVAPTMDSTSSPCATAVDSVATGTIEGSSCDVLALAAGNEHCLPFVSLDIPEYGSVPALLDSGAFWNYAPLRLLEDLGFSEKDLTSCEEVVTLANGSKSHVCGTISINNLVFRVLNSNVDYLIIGVKSMYDLGISLSFGDGHSAGLFAISMGQAHTIASLCACGLTGYDGRDQLCTVWSPNLFESTLTGEVSPVCDWLPVVGSEGYCWRARALEPDEERDTATQRYAIEVMVPYDKEKVARYPSRGDYGRRMVEKMEEAEQVKFLAEVQKYEHKLWWKKIGPVETNPPSPGTLVVFPVRAKKVGSSTPIRPVLDARLRNLFSPVSSYDGPTIGSILLDLRLRYKRHSRVLVRDASAAFYRIRLEKDSVVELVANGVLYKSCRLCFGLRAGPCCLWAGLTFILDLALSELSDKVKEYLWNCSIYLYLDDLTLVINEGGDSPYLVDGRSVADILLEKITEVAGRYGFDFPREKGCDSADQKDFKHLGIRWVFDKENSGDLGSVCLKHKVGQYRDENNKIKTKWTKRSLYSLSAVVSSGCDPLLIHGSERLAGDVLKIIGGALAKGQKWDDEFVIKEDDPAYHVLSLCLETIERYQGTECYHPVHELVPGDDEIHVYVDASSLAWSWVMMTYDAKSESESMLQSSGGIFKGAARNFHINRKELIALSKATLAIHSALSGKRRYPLVSRVVIFSDSQTVNRWVTTNKCSVRSLERVVVRRLTEAIREIIGDLQSTGVSVVVRKVDSDSNKADALSRLPLLWGYDRLDFVDGGDVPIFPSANPVHTVQGGDEALGQEESVLLTGVLTRDSLKQLQRQSPFWKPVVEFVESGRKGHPVAAVLKAAECVRLTHDGVLMGLRYAHGSVLQEPREVYIVPGDTTDGRNLSFRICLSFHNGNHYNPRYLRYEISRKFDISGLSKLCSLVYRQCKRCQQAAVTRFYKGFLGHTDIPSSSIWDSVCLDIAGPFPKDVDTHYTVALVCVDMYSHYAIIVGLHNQRSQTVCGALNRLIQEYGVMRELRSDGGPCFVSAYFKRWLVNKGVSHRVVNKYSPFENGLAEKTISGLKSSIRLFPEVLRSRYHDSSHWYEVASKAVRRLNDRPYLNTTPFALWFGRERRSEEEARLSLKPKDTTVEALKKQREEMKGDFDRERSLRTPGRQFSPRSLKISPGQKVKVFRPSSLAGVGHSRGLLKKPVYTVVSQRGVDVELLEDGKSAGNEVTEHIRNIRPYYA